MKIGIAVKEFHKKGGIERAAVELANALAESGQQITVFSSTFEHGGKNLQYIPIPALKLSTSTFYATFRIMSKKILRSTPVDILHAHGTEPSLRDIVTAQSCHRAGMEIRSKARLSVNAKRNFHIADTLRLLGEKEAFKMGSYKKIIAVSTGLKKEIMEYYNVPDEDIIVIPNGINTKEFFEPSPEMKIEARNKLGIKEDEFVLLFVANEFDRKGLDYVIDALALIRSPKIRLLVVGGDNARPYEEYARKKGVTDKITFAGLQRNLTPFYHAGDVFVLPTLYEAFALATIEAASCGLPLVVTKVNGTEDLVKNGFNGFFIERESEHISEKINTVLQNVSLRQQLSMNAIATARDYTWQSIAHRTLIVYKEILRG